MLLLVLPLSTVGQRVAVSGFNIYFAVQAGTRRRILRYPIWVGNKKNENASFGPGFVSRETETLSAVTAKSKKIECDESRPKDVYFAEFWAYRVNVVPLR
tara:strand:+ start:6834 stop:7133 length:300 start_codon:yes stop_codon:yes gene_type:complete